MNHPQCVLIAEDDRVMRTASALALRRHGLTVLLAEDGAEALAAARAERPDLILLDLLMPKVSGIDVLRALKSDAATRDIRVVILSNSSRDLERQDATTLGALDYLIKSDLKLRELVERVDGFLRTPP